MNRKAAALIAGVALGALYTVTPVTIWAALLAVVIIGASAARVSPEERRALITICAVALALRVLAVAAMAVIGIPQHNDLATGALSGDDAYNLSRALRTRDVLLDRPVTKYDYFVSSDEYGYSRYLLFLTWAQVFAGPTPYSMRLLNAVIFLGGALLLCHVARRAFGSVASFAGLAVLLVVPSLAASSVSLLKEPVYFAMCAVLVWSAAQLAQGRSVTSRVIAAAAMAGTFFLLDDLRRGAVILLGSGIALAFLVRLAFWRWWTGLTAAAAATAVAAVVLTSATIQQRALSGLESAAKLHSGHVFTVGHAYKLLDEGFYVNPQATVSSTLTLTPPQAARFVIRGLTSFAVTPWPWQIASRRELLFLPELILWYLILALAPLGVIAGWKVNPFITSLLLCVSLPTAVALALTTGNVGTLLRLRGLVMPYLIFLSVAGLCWLIARFWTPRDVPQLG